MRGAGRTEGGVRRERPGNGVPTREGVRERGVLGTDMVLQGPTEAGVACYLAWELGGGGSMEGSEQAARGGETPTPRSFFAATTVPRLPPCPHLLRRITLPTLVMAAPSSPTFERGEPWFDDGNIVLLADASGVAFKVHRGMLARHSEIFQSMFELPPPSQADVEKCDGCQLVRMYDLPDELSNLIKALYDGA